MTDTGDVRDIRSTLYRAAQRFLADDQLDPQTRAMIVTILNGRLATVDEWLAPPEWTLE